MSILTKKGRENFGIVKVLISPSSLGDDEIDYTLYEQIHQKGSVYYDAVIKAKYQ